MSRADSGLGLSVVAVSVATITMMAAVAPSYGDDSLAYRTVALTGEPAPGTEPGTTFSSFTTALNHSIMVPRIDEAGRLAFIAIIDGVDVGETNQSGIWAESGGVLSLVVRTGSQAPGTPPGVVFAGLPSEYLPFPPQFAGGQAVFQGVLTGPGVDSAFSIRVGGSDWNVNVVYSDRSGTLRPEVKPGDVGPGPGEPFTIFGGPFLNDQDHIAFSASTATGQWPPMGIYCTSCWSVRCRSTRRS